jgi:hypothetical protein
MFFPVLHSLRFLPRDTIRVYVRSCAAIWFIPAFLPSLEEFRFSGPSRSSRSSCEEKNLLRLSWFPGFLRGEFWCFSDD